MCHRNTDPLSFPLFHSLFHVQGPHGFTKQWDNGQGFKIFSYFWPTTADKPKGILLLLHGHSIKQKVETARIFEFLKSSGDGGLEEEKKKRKKVYSESWIEELNKQGYSCCGIDVQAKRPKGYQKMKTYIKSFDDVSAEDLAFIEKLPELGGKPFSKLLPVFLVVGFR